MDMPKGRKTMAGPKTAKKAKKKAGKKKDAAVTTGKGNPGKVGAMAKKPKGIAAMMGKKAKGPTAPSSTSDTPTVKSDKKLPGHEAKQEELAAQKAEIQRRIGVYESLVGNKDANVSAEAARLITEAKKELADIEAELGKSGLVTDEWREARGQMADAEKRMKIAFGLIKDELERRRLDMSRAQRGEISSLKVNGLTYTAGSVVTGLSGKSMDSEEKVDAREEALREVFGDRYDEFFLRKKAMSLNMELLDADPEFAEGLFAAIIEFCLENDRDPRDIVPEKDTLVGLRALVTARVMDPEVEELFEAAVDEGLMGLKAAYLKK
jgi:hypothetical protein